jgi:hypothetical protein
MILNFALAGRSAMESMSPTELRLIQADIDEKVMGIVIGSSCEESPPVLLNPEVLWASLALRACHMPQYER